MATVNIFQYSHPIIALIEEFFSVDAFCLPTRNILYTGHLPVPAGGHWYRGHPPDGAADAYPEGVQHPDLGPVLLLLHSSH